MQKKILIVEDEYDIASTMTLILDMENYEVRHAANGLEAMDILKAEALPHLIISDVMMPLMDGYELTKTLRALKRYESIPILLTSAARLDNSKINPKLIHGFLRKPFELDNFLDIVKLALLDKK